MRGIVAPLNQLRLGACERAPPSHIARRQATRECAAARGRGAGQGQSCLPLPAAAARFGHMRALGEVGRRSAAQPPRHDAPLPHCSRQRSHASASALGRRPRAAFAVGVKVGRGDLPQVTQCPIGTGRNRQQRGDLGQPSAQPARRQTRSCAFPRPRLAARLLCAPLRAEMRPAKFGRFLATEASFLLQALLSRSDPASELVRQPAASPLANVAPGATSRPPTHRSPNPVRTWLHGAAHARAAPSAPLVRLASGR